MAFDSGKAKFKKELKGMTDEELHETIALAPLAQTIFAIDRLKV